MARDDIVFVVILVGSVAVSGLLRFCPPKWRADMSAIAGVVALVAACGWPNALHPLSAIAAALLCLKLTPQRQRGSMAFALAFGHLAILRLSPSPPGGPTNAALLLLVLRLAAADGAVAAGGGDGTGKSAASSSASPGALELVRYACCFHGLFTGPYYSYAAWNEMMRAPRPVPAARQLGVTLLSAVGALAVWRGVASYLPYAAVWGEHTPAWAYWQRLLYFYASSFQFRWRFYTCWLVMQLSGEVLGAADSSNAIISQCELATSPSSYIAGWNTSVQAWLKENAYRRLLPASTPRLVRQLATFAVSAFWHGVRPGYYLFFLGLFCMVGVEQVVRAAASKALNDRAVGLRGALLACVCHVWTMMCFGFFGGAFNLLDYRDTLELWRALRFYGLGLTALPAVPAALLLLALPTVKRRPKGD